MVIKKILSYFNFVSKVIFEKNIRVAMFLENPGKSGIGKRLPGPGKSLKLGCSPRKTLEWAKFFAFKFKKYSRVTINGEGMFIFFVIFAGPNFFLISGISLGWLVS